MRSTKACNAPNQIEILLQIGSGRPIKKNLLVGEKTSQAYSGPFGLFAHYQPDSFPHHLMALQVKNLKMIGQLL